MQARDGAELRPVAPGKDDGVPAPLLDQGPLRVGGLVGPDAFQRVGRSSRALNEPARGDEGVALRAGPGVKMNGRSRSAGSGRAA